MIKEHEAMIQKQAAERAHYSSGATGRGLTASPLDLARCEATKTAEPGQTEIRRAIRRGFDLSDSLSAQIALLEERIQPIMRPSHPSLDTKAVESMTEIGSSLEQLNARMELMLEAVCSMIARAEV